jgi:hypothetical protein
VASSNNSGRRTAKEAWADFGRVWSAHSLSVFGDQLTLVALPLATYAETGSAVAVGLVASAEAVTAVGLGLAAGALADKLPHRRVLVWSDLVRAFVLCLLAGALLLPSGAVAALAVAAVLLGIARVLHDAAFGAVLPLVVEGPDLLAANGRMQASEAAATAVGPAIAGGLIALGGVGTAFLVDAATFIGSGTAVANVRRLDEHAPQRVPFSSLLRNLRSDVMEGLQAVRADAAMVRVLVVVAAMNVVAVCVEAQFIPYASEVLDIGALGIGIYWAVGGTAAVATSLLVGRRTTASGSAILFGTGMFAAGVLIAGLWPSFFTATVMFVAAGVGSALVVTHMASMRHRRFPIELQGRVAMVARTAVFLVVPIPLIGGGWLARVAGPEALFLTTASAGLGAVAWGWLYGLGRVREG